MLIFAKPLKCARILQKERSGRKQSITWKGLGKEEISNRTVHLPNMK
jgi:hypothetical protein